MTIFSNTDTIAAIATANGRAGIGVIRLSGNHAKKIAEKITQQTFIARHAHFAKFYDQHQQVIDEGIALFFQHPHSFTGEDVVELQGHGGPIVLNLLLKTIIQYGARLAKPGEFSERAFLNHKIDLSQAEAIADLINANSEQAARSAARSLRGEFAKKIHLLQEQLTQLRVHIESMIDFSDEEIDFLDHDQITQSLQKTIDSVFIIQQQAKQGVLLQHGLQIVIAGKPNAGKSSLLNYLSGRDSAIVTDIPGTTRDILRESIHIDGMPLHVIDTAGLRDTTDMIEQEGVRRAYQQIQDADLILLMIDAQECAQQSIKSIVTAFQEKLPTSKSIIVLKNKIDLTRENSGIMKYPDFTVIQLSIQNNQGLNELIDYLKQWAGFQSIGENQFIARQRHVDAINRAHEYLLQAKNQWETIKAHELIAEELRQSQLALSEITGEVSSDDLLGEIFSQFCVGK